MSDYSQVSPFPFLIDDRFKFSAVGRQGKGGWLKIAAANQPAPSLLRLGPAMFGLAALLILAGQKSVAQGWGAAFLSAETIAAELYRRTRIGNSDPANVPRAVYRLRSLINNSPAFAMDSDSAASPPEWGRLVVEHQASVGYRLSLRPENLHLEILGDSKDNAGG